MRTVNVKGESVVKGGKCTTEKMSPRPHTITFTWGTAKAKAFSELKQCFTTAPVLTYLDNDCQFRLETDTSDFATGAVLSILKGEKWHPIAFSSHTMSLEE